MTLLVGKNIKELKEICKKNPKKYKGYSTYTKKADLLSFMLSKESKSSKTVKKITKKPKEEILKDIKVNWKNFNYAKKLIGKKAVLNGGGGFANEFTIVKILGANDKTGQIKVFDGVREFEPRMYSWYIIGLDDLSIDISDLDIGSYLITGNKIRKQDGGIFGTIYDCTIVKVIDEKTGKVSDYVPEDIIDRFKFYSEKYGFMKKTSVGMGNGHSTKDNLALFIETKNISNDWKEQFAKGKKLVKTSKNAVEKMKGKRKGKGKGIVMIKLDDSGISYPKMYLLAIYEILGEDAKIYKLNKFHLLIGKKGKYNIIITPRF